MLLELLSRGAHPRSEGRQGWRRSSRNRVRLELKTCAVAVARLDRGSLAPMDALKGRQVCGALRVGNPMAKNRAMAKGTTHRSSIFHCRTSCECSRWGGASTCDTTPHDGGGLQRVTPPLCDSFASLASAQAQSISPFTHVNLWTTFTSGNLCNLTNINPWYVRGLYLRVPGGS
jgi:hypothetical protein